MSGARLLVRGPDDRDEQIVLGEETRIGRAPENDLALEDARVSRMHAIIRRVTDGDSLLMDLGSTNGTLLNGVPLSAPARLRSGDVVAIGNFHLTYLEDEVVPSNVEQPIRTVAAHGRSITADVLIGSSPAMAQVFRLVDRAAELPLGILLEGETGTGKEMVARALHRASAGAGAPFVGVRCCNLSESDLDTSTAGRGPIAAARGGSLFLDEIAEIRPSVQVRLLHALDELSAAVAPERSPGLPRESALRVISSSNQDLEQLTARGELRKDLYFRLAGFRIVVPPLRERREDIAPLASAFARASSERQGKRVGAIDRRALDTLTARDWPGNVRELRNEIERAVALARDGEAITLAHLSVPGENIAPPDATAMTQAVSLTGGPPIAADEAPDPAAGEAVFRRDGEVWTVRYAGSTALLKDNKGLRLIVRLLGDPWHEFHALELAAEVDVADARAPVKRGPRDRTVDLASAAGAPIQALDPQAKQEYRHRLAELAEELESAEDDNDPGRAERARTEIDFLTQQLSAAVGLGGRNRPVGGHDERARLLVTQRIKASLRKIAEVHPALHEHLQETLRTGYRCSYVPDPSLKVAWQTR